ncbi:MAG: hypothetical protein QNL04_14185 [SAR324 cluster bacterium]|nr:hypothetical protein [SAR324 cluster bacterium]
MKIKLGFFALISAALLFGCDKAPETTKTMSEASSSSMHSDTMNPCGMKKTQLNPCSLEAKGKMLWNDTSLGTTGMACTSCHAGGAQLKLNLAFPHHVNMVNKTVKLPEMINFCITNPLKGKAIAEDSDKMQAMIAYYNFMAMHGKGMHNPCGMSNPCGMHKDMGNPCGMHKDMGNPCGMHKDMGNPCGVGNPCATHKDMGNPCAHH